MLTAEKPRAADEPRVINGTLLKTRAEAPNGVPYDHRFIFSTELVASDGGVIKLGAWDTREYMKRPRWITRHDLWGDPAYTSLGRTVAVGVEDNLPTELVGMSGRGLVGYVVYASTPYAQQVKTLYEEGALDDVSVRWDGRTEKVRYRDEMTDAEKMLYGENCYWIADYVQLMEVSSILYGADSGAKHLRSEVEEVLSRCREAGKPLDQIEAIRERLQKQTTDDDSKTVVPVGRAFPPKKKDDVADEEDDTPDDETKPNDEKPTTKSGADDVLSVVDTPALSDAMEGLIGALGRLDQWMDVGTTIRVEINEVITSIRNLLVTGLNGAADTTDDGNDAATVAAATGEDRSAEEAKPVTNEMLRSISDRLDELGKLVRQSIQVETGEVEKPKSETDTEVKAVAEGAATDEAKPEEKSVEEPAPRAKKVFCNLNKLFQKTPHQSGTTSV